jgi:hypothetical protein
LRFFCLEFGLKLLIALLAIFAVMDFPMAGRTDRCYPTRMIGAAIS